MFEESFLLSIMSLYVLGGKVTDIIKTSSKPSSLATTTTTTTTTSEKCIFPYSWLENNNIVINPNKEKYQHNDSVSFSCMQGYFLQKPVGLITFSSYCNHGIWTFNSSMLPKCNASCRSWNTRSKNWEPIYITDEKSFSGYILSPDYPRSIITVPNNCTFTFITNDSLIQLESISIHLYNYYISIESDKGKYSWPMRNETNNNYVLHGLKNLKITVLHRMSSVNNIGKAENFKIKYQMRRGICETNYMQELIIVNNTNLDNDHLEQQYSCPYPYTLMGSNVRKCSYGTWDILEIPRCDFVCSRNKIIHVNKTLYIKNEFQNILKCRIELKSLDEMIIKIRLQNTVLNPKTFCLIVKSKKYSNNCVKADSRYNFFPSPITLSYTDLNSYFVTEKFEMIIELSPKIFCPFIKFNMKNGNFIARRSEIFSFADVHCNENYFWTGSPKIICTLNNDGTAKWDIKRDKDCVKICNDDTKLINLSNEPLFINLPSFLNKNFSSNQTCKWKIVSKFFNPIIQITSLDDLKKHSNISVYSQSQKDTQLLINHPVFVTETSTLRIFICPYLICILEIHPSGSLSSLSSNTVSQVIVKFNDREYLHEQSPIYWFIFLSILLLITPLIALMLIDYWRHPYTGYTAKFINTIKNYQTHKLSSLFIFEVKTFQFHSKTQSDIIVFYHKYHPDNRSICIRRSFPTIEANENPFPSWKYRFSSVRRRFSDITDLVLYSCTIKPDTDQANQIDTKEDCNPNLEV